MSDPHPTAFVGETVDPCDGCGDPSVREIYVVGGSIHVCEFCDDILEETYR